MAVNDVSIGKKVAGAFGAVLVIIAAMCGGLFWTLDNLADATAEAVESRTTIQAVDATEAALVEMQNSTRGFVASRDETFIKSYNEHYSHYQTALSTLSDIAATPVEQASIAQLKTAAQVFREETQAQITNSRTALSRPTN